MAKSGRANFLKLLFWTGILKILAKTLVSGYKYERPVFLALMLFFKCSEL